MNEGLRGCGAPKTGSLDRVCVGWGVSGWEASVGLEGDLGSRGMRKLDPLLAGKESVLSEQLPLRRGQ